MVKNEKEYEVESDDILCRIIKMLEEYPFTLKRGSEQGKALNPKVLGYVFEKTVNYLAQTLSSDEEKPNKSRKKKRGAFYTPDEYTKYLCTKTIHPLLLKKFQKRLQEKWGWHKEEAEAYTSLGDFLDPENIPPKPKLLRDLLELVSETKVCDPACGSGHFLTSALNELFQVKKQILRELGKNIDYYELKKETVKNSLYGVDLEPAAVEIAKLRLWLKIVEDLKVEEGEDHPLPNIDFNIRVGNSLSGFSQPQVNLNGQKLLINKELKEELSEYSKEIKEYRSTTKKEVALRQDLSELNRNLEKRLDQWFIDYLNITGEFSKGKELNLEELMEEMSEPDSEVKLRFRFNTSMEETLKKKLRNCQFHAYKKSAKLKLPYDFEPEKVKDKIQEAYNAIPNNKEFEITLERSIIPSDLREISTFHLVLFKRQ